MKYRILTFFISVIIILSLSLCAYGETVSYTYTQTDVSEYSSVSYLDPRSGNYSPMTYDSNSGNVNLGNGSSFPYDFRYTKQFPANMTGDGSLRFLMEMENPYLVGADVNTIKLQFKCMVYRNLSRVLSGYQDARLLVNGRSISLAGVTVDEIGSQRYVISLYADVSSVTQGKELSLEGFSLTLNFDYSNPYTSASSVNCYCQLPVFEFSSLTVSDMIQDATNKITENADENTQRIIDNNGKIADKVIDNQNQNTQEIIDNNNKNTQEIIDSNKQNTQELIDSNKQNTQDIIDGDPANDEMLKQQEEIFNSIKASEELFNKSITGDLDLKTDEMLDRFGEVQEITTDGTVIDSNNWIQDLFSAVMPPINVNFWAEYFLLVPVALSVIIMFSIKILRTVVPSVVQRSHSDEIAKVRKDSYGEGFRFGRNFERDKKK